MMSLSQDKRLSRASPYYKMLMTDDAMRKLEHSRQVKKVETEMLSDKYFAQVSNIRDAPPHFTAAYDSVAPTSSTILSPKLL